MPTPPGSPRVRKTFLLFLVIAISVLFGWMIRSFIVTLLLAAIFSAMARPLNRWLTTKLRNSPNAGSIATILVLLILVAGPSIAFLGIVAAQAVDISQAAGPWVADQLSEPAEVDQFIAGLPYVGEMLPKSAEIAAKLGSFAASTGRFLANSIVDVTRGTVNFFLQFFILLYAMFFFLADGQRVMQRILYYVPLSPETEQDLADKFVSVTRAVLKGSLVIGLIQGALSGLAFWLFGIPGWAFWTTVMIVLSIIPAVGGALVWIPAVVYLVVSGDATSAVLLALWCGLVVGTVDNFLRPKLVGRDTKMPDLLVLIGTLGGIVLFGVVGFILGPIVAALFLAVWEQYGEAFKDSLPGHAPGHAPGHESEGAPADPVAPAPIVQTSE